jgi:predicted 2-oxoglutarate/Fe(II)-dependent dioxygenase YbiX
MPLPPGYPVVHTIPDLLDQASCLRLRQGMNLGHVEDAEVLLPESPLALASGGIDVRDQIRRARGFEVAASLLAEVEGLLDGQMATLSAVFGLRLTEREGSGFIRYGPGGYYHAHRDWAEASSWPGAARRQIAAVLFLNSARQAESAGDFEGGQLRLYADDPSVEPLDVIPRAGTLVAFPARQWHEVMAVRSGTRDVVVDWYY